MQDRAGRASQSIYIGSGVLDCSVEPQGTDDEEAGGVLTGENVAASDYGITALTEGGETKSVSAKNTDTPPSGKG